MDEDEEDDDFKTMKESEVGDDEANMYQDGDVME